MVKTTKPIKHDSSYYQDSQAYLYISPLVTHFKWTARQNGNNGGGGRRGKITVFSAKSRRRLIRYLFSLEKSPVVMVTLTYPKEWNPDYEVWKRDLDVFLKRVARKFPKYWFIWKLEFQKRGAPHFHLLGSFGEGVVVNKEVMEWVSRAWYEVVNSGYEKHLKAGTNIEVLDSKKKVIFYVCKYISKEDMPKDENKKSIKVGRWWGKSGNVPNRCVVAVRFNVSEYVMVKRLVKRWVKANVREALKKGKRKLFGFYKWLKKFHRSNWYIYIDMITMVKLIKAVCNYPIEMMQIKPCEVKFVL